MCVVFQVSQTTLVNNAISDAAAFVHVCVCVCVCALTHILMRRGHGGGRVRVTSRACNEESNLLQGILANEASQTFALGLDRGFSLY